MNRRTNGTPRHRRKIGVLGNAPYRQNHYTQPYIYGHPHTHYQYPVYRPIHVNPPLPINPPLPPNRCPSGSSDISYSLELSYANPFFTNGTPQRLPPITSLVQLTDSPLFKKLNEEASRMTEFKINEQTTYALTLLGYACMCPSNNMTYTVHSHTPVSVPDRSSHDLFRTDPTIFIYSILKPIIMEWAALSRLWNSALTASSESEILLTGGSALWFYGTKQAGFTTNDYDYKIVPISGDHFRNPLIIFKLWVNYTRMLSILLNHVMYTLIEHQISKYGLTDLEIRAHDFRPFIVSGNKAYPGMELESTHTATGNNTTTTAFPDYMNMISMDYVLSYKLARGRRQRLTDIIMNDTSFMENEQYRFFVKNIPSQHRVTLPSSIAAPCGIRIISYEYIIEDIKDIIRNCSTRHSNNNLTINLKNPCASTKEVREKLLNKYLYKAKSINANNKALSKYVTTMIYVARTNSHKNTLLKIQEALEKYNMDIENLLRIDLIPYKPRLMTPNAMPSVELPLAPLNTISRQCKPCENESSNNNVSKSNQKPKDWLNYLPCCRRRTRKGGKGGRGGNKRKTPRFRSVGGNAEVSIGISNIIKYVKSGMEPVFSDETGNVLY